MATWIILGVTLLVVAVLALVIFLPSSRMDEYGAP